MTEITAEKNLLGRKLSITGHADRTEDMTSGNLICAALSILTQTMAENLLSAEDEGRADIITLDLHSGEAVMDYITDDDSVNNAFDAMMTGFALLAERYPETVRVSSALLPEVQGSVDLCRFDGEDAAAPEAEEPAQEVQTESGEQHFLSKVKQLKSENNARQSRILDAVAERYGLRRGDLNALEDAVNRERGEHTLESMLGRWRGQESAVKELYPSFELKAALCDRNFFSLLYKGLDLRSAYELVHREELLRSAMEYAAKISHDMTAGQLARSGARTREGALSDGEPAEHKPAALTKKQRNELIRRAERGERIKL